ncbi:MAG: helix-turn-helix transcriptional regulator [Chloroflexia bacterium]|nr:helix-turn-helix transcriptional regulator [Chloroflexia bacterium]
MDKKNLEKYGNPEHCPIRNVVERIGDKWSMLVILLLDEEQVLRFNEIHKYIRTISQKMLTVTLKSLEADGLVVRTVYPQIPPKVEYKLTQRGETLIPHLHNLVQWAKENMDEIRVLRKSFEKNS